MAPSDLATLYTSVAAPYRARGTWMVGTDMLTKILEWRDSTDQPIVQQMASSPSGLAIWGRPVVENPAFAAPASAVANAIAFGDMSTYHVVRLPVRAELSRDYRFSNDQLALRVIERVDGRLIDVAGVNKFTCSDT